MASTSGSYVGWLSERRGALVRRPGVWTAPSPPHTPPPTYAKHLLPDNQGGAPLGEPRLERHRGGRGAGWGWGGELPGRATRTPACPSTTPLHRACPTPYLANWSFPRCMRGGWCRHSGAAGRTEPGTEMTRHRAIMQWLVVGSRYGWYPMALTLAPFRSFGRLFTQSIWTRFL